MTLLTRNAAIAINVRRVSNFLILRWLGRIVIYHVNVECISVVIIFESWFCIRLYTQFLSLLLNVISNDERVLESHPCSLRLWFLFLNQNAFICLCDFLEFPKVEE